MDWHESEPSEEENNTRQSSSTRKRSSRACDQCRKTKSKCEAGAPGANQCKSCALAGTACTFLGPSYKRGPPKGYIRAIEMRWHQVESLLGAVMQCNDPRVQGIVQDLRQDNLAREILNRVDMGPYGPTGRLSQPSAATKEDFFASVLRSNTSSTAAAASAGPANASNNPRDASRIGRQSRISREKVSCTQDGGISVVPTPEWQDQLCQRLASGSSSSSYDSPNSSLDGSGRPFAQKRRLNSQSPVGNITPDQWKNMYTLEPDASDQESIDDPTEKMGGLSLDENRNIRYHSQASGLHHLSINARTDGRLEGGVWTLPMARVWPASKDYVQTEDEYDVQLPPPEVQDRLLDLYFAYVHPAFPVIHKSRFLARYNEERSRQTSSGYAALSPASRAELPHLLLFSIFAIAARYYNDERQTPDQGKMWDGGGEYFDSARTILGKVLHQSSPANVQSLLLLGYREFGIGSMEQGWLYIGMALRMAIDLGLNCNTQFWTYRDNELFNAEERQSQRQIWWCCVLADTMGSTYMGRPVLVRDSDFDTPFPDPGPEDQEIWRPVAHDPVQINYTPAPCRTTICFVATSKLCIIMDSIVSKIYPVRLPPGVSRRSLLPGLEKELDQFYVNLPEVLRYDPSSKRNIPPPHILFLHIRYFAAVLLLHRAFIPNWKRAESARRSTLEMKAFDLAQSSASQISNIVSIYRDVYTLKRCSPFLPSFIFSAGIMHLLTLTLRPSNVQATVGLRQALAALDDAHVEWPSAARAWELLHHVKVGFAEEEQIPSPSSGVQDRRKRIAEDAFGADQGVLYGQQDMFQSRASSIPTSAPSPPEQGHGVQEMSQRIMAHFLGLDVPGVEPSTSYLPGYEWWPRGTNGHGGGHDQRQPVQQPQQQQQQPQQQRQQQMPSMTSSLSSSLQPMGVQSQGALPGLDLEAASFLDSSSHMGGGGGMPGTNMPSNNMGVNGLPHHGLTQQQQQHPVDPRAAWVNNPVPYSYKFQGYGM